MGPRQRSVSWDTTEHSTSIIINHKIKQNKKEDNCPRRQQWGKEIVNLKNKNNVQTYTHVDRNTPTGHTQKHTKQNRGTLTSRDTGMRELVIKSWSYTISFRESAANGTVLMLNHYMLAQSVLAWLKACWCPSKYICRVLSARQVRPFSGCVIFWEQRFLNDAIALWIYLRFRLVFSWKGVLFII